MWVQLKSVKRIEVSGKPKTYQPGDWVDVGKQTALLWISEGAASIPEGYTGTLLNPDECGVFIWGHEDRGIQALGGYAGSLQVQSGNFLELDQLPYHKTMVYHPGLRLRKELVPVGFHLLDTWQVAIPLYDYDKLAVHLAQGAERERTAAVLPDLRVPMYAWELMFLRRCDETGELLRVWREEQEAPDAEPHADTLRLSLLRALYRVKPLVLALPTTWLWKDMGA